MDGKRNAPFEPVVVVKVWPVPSAFAAICAPSIAPPVESTTVPAKMPSLVCASSCIPEQQNIKATVARRTSAPIFFVIEDPGQRVYSAPVAGLYQQQNKGDASFCLAILRISASDTNLYLQRL